LINCNLAGDCWGGRANWIYEFALEKGLVEETCMAYAAKNLDIDHHCEPINMCSECGPPMPAEGEKSKNCHEIKDFKRYFISDKFPLFGHFKMMQEVYAHGPISCNIWEGDKLRAYKGGIFYEKGPTWFYRFMNHVVEVVGYGHINNDEEKGFWAVRNIIGSYWGENGFYRVRMG
jgi:cathepsin X